jgi:hypothetical protein
LSNEASFTINDPARKILPFDAANVGSVSLLAAALNALGAYPNVICIFSAQRDTVYLNPDCHAIRSSGNGTFVMKFGRIVRGERDA